MGFMAEDYSYFVCNSSISFLQLGKWFFALRVGRGLGFVFVSSLVMVTTMCHFFLLLNPWIISIQNRMVIE